MLSILNNIVGLSWQDYCKYNTHLLVVEPSYTLFYFIFIYAWLQIYLNLKIFIKGLLAINPIFYLIY